MVSKQNWSQSLPTAKSICLESGFIIFKLIEGTLAHSDVRVEVLMDDMVFPSYTSSKARSKHTQFGESKRDLCRLSR